MTKPIYLKLVDLSELKGLTREQARDYVGKYIEQGVVIGVCGKPSAAHNDGIYLIASKKNEASKYYRVGE